MNLGVGIDLSQFRKDLSYFNKQLKTASGQEIIINTKFDSKEIVNETTGQVTKITGKLRQGIINASTELKKSLSDLNEVFTKNAGKLKPFDFDGDAVKQAKAAVRVLQKELKEVQKRDDSSPNKKGLVDAYRNDIAVINEYISAVGRLSDAMAKAGLASSEKVSAQRKSERAAISEEVKLLQKKQELNRNNLEISAETRLNEEIRLQKQLISLLEKKSRTYASGRSKANDEKLTSARNTLDELNAQKKYISVLEKIDSLEKKRASAKGLSSKIAQFQQERIAVTGLITWYEKYLSIARKANDTSEIARANAKLDVLRKEAIELRNLEKAERDRIRAVNQNKSLFNEQIGIIEKLKTYASNYLSIYSLFRVGKEMIDATKYFEQQRVALEGIVGSAIEATKALNGLKQMALESPFELKSLVGYTKQLSAYGIEVEALLPTVDSLADLSAGLGVDMSRLILAYGQVNAASVLRGQELRQFTEAGIPLVEKLSEKFTQLNGKLVTTGEVFEMISKRQVSFEMVAEVLRDMTAEGGAFYKMQENLTDTLYGQIEKLKDTWTIQLNEVGSKVNWLIRGVVESLQKVIHNIPLLLSAISFAGLIKTATALPALFKKVGNSIHAINIQMRWFERGLNRTVGAGNKLAFVFKNMLASLKSNLVVAAISLIGGAIINAAAKTREWKKELEEIDRSFAKDTAKYTVGFEKLISRLAMATEGTKEYNDAIETLKSNYGDYVSDALINQLIDERRQLQDTAQGWGMLHDSIVAAIEAKKEYERHETRKNTAAEGLIEDFNVNKVVRGLRHYVKNLRESVNDGGHQSAYEEYDEIYSALKNDDIKTALRDAIADFTEAGETSIDDFERRLIRKLKMQSIDTKASDYIIEKIGSIFERVTKSKKWETYLKELGILENDPYELIKKEFSNAKNIVFNSQEGRWADGMKNTDYNPFQLSVVEDQQAAIAAKNLIDNFFENLSDEDINNQSSFKKAKDAITNAFGDLSLEAFQADAGKTKTIADALNSLFTTINKSDLRAQLSAITNAFLEMAGTKTGRAKSISSAIMANYGAGSNADQATKDFMARYLPNDENIDELRDAIAKEISSLRSKIKSYGPTQENEGNREYVEQMKAELKKYETLASDKYYDITEEEVKAAGKKDLYKRLRITNFFDELLSVITKAEDAMKDVVGVTGYTDQLGEFVKGLKPDNFLRAFFEEGGNPFEKIFANMTEYGVTEFLPEFNKNTLENMFRSVGWEEGKEISIPDFQAMYEKIIKQIAEQVLTNLRVRRAQYTEDTSEYNSLDSAIKSMQDFQLKSIETMETRWGGDEIEKKIDAAIKELTNINGNLESIKTQRDMFDRISKSGNYLTAQQAIYGNQDYKRFDAVGGYRQSIIDMLNSSGGKGIAGTNPGIALMNLLNGGNLNISNLSALLDIVKALKEQTASVSKEDAEQFKKVTEFITSAINGMSEEILSEYEKLMALRTDNMVVSDNITNLAQKYKDGIATIVSGLKEGLITIEEAMDMRVKLLQDNYSELRTNLGGTELPKWVTQLYGDPNTKSGISQKGSILDMIFNSGNLENIIGNTLAGKVSNGAMSATEAAGAMSAASASIAMVDAIIKAVYQAINSITEFSKEMIEVLEKTDNRLNLSKGAGGKLYDEDGNLNISDEYYNKQNNREIAKMAFDTIGNFNDHVMSGWEKLKSGDALGATFEVIMSIADLIADIAGIGDSKIQHQQDELVRSNDRLSNAMESLEHALKSSVGNEKYDIYSEQLKNFRMQQLQYEQLLALENEKKSGDSEKAEDYAKQATELGRQIDDLINNLKSEILGTADELASSLTDALVGAFREGTNAARAWRDAVKGYIGDILKQELMTKVIAPFFDGIMDDFFGVSGMTDEQKKAYFEKLGSEGVIGLFSDENRVNDFVRSLNSAGITLIDLFNNLPEDLQDYIAYNGSTSALAGGISGITEDTARTLEGLANSQLMQLITINKVLTQYLESDNSYERSYMANVQTHLQQINNNVGLILNSITELRDTPSRPLHVTIA